MSVVVESLDAVGMPTSLKPLKADSTDSSMALDGGPCGFKFVVRGCRRRYAPVGCNGIEHNPLAHPGIVVCGLSGETGRPKRSSGGHPRQLLLEPSFVRYFRQELPSPGVDSHGLVS